MYLALRSSFAKISLFYSETVLKVVVINIFFIFWYTYVILIFIKNETENIIILLL